MDMNFPHGHLPPQRRRQSDAKHLHKVSYAELIALSHNGKSYTTGREASGSHHGKADMVSTRINLLGQIDKEVQSQKAAAGSFGCITEHIEND